jgi:hypothetical protein
MVNKLTKRCSISSVLKETQNLSKSSWLILPIILANNETMITKKA